MATRADSEGGGGPPLPAVRPGTAAEPSAPSAPSEWRATALPLLTSNALPLGLLLLVLVFSFTARNFFTVGNFRDVLAQSSTTMVVAVPATLLLIAGKVDLSVGSTLALGAVVTGLLINAGLSPVLAAAVGVAAGGAVGLLNGIAVGVLGLSPIIVTLGMLTAVRGLALIVSPEALYGFSPGFIAFGNDTLLGVPYLVLVALALVAVGVVILNLLPVGRHIFAIGVNDRAALLAGVRGNRVVLALYVFSGAAAGLAGVLSAARLGSAPSGTLGTGFELIVLTTVLLGGVAFTGGRGSIRGAVLGVLFLSTVQNGLTILNSPTATALVISGGALVVAAVLDRFGDTDRVGQALRRLR